MTSRKMGLRPSDEAPAGPVGAPGHEAGWSVECYRRFFLTSPLAMLRESAGGEILEVNPALADLLGYAAPSDLTGQSVAVTFADPELAGSSRSLLLREGEVAPRDVRLARLDGGGVWAEHHAILVPVPNTGQTEIFRTFIDVDARREEERGLREMAYHDELTGVPNRRLLEIRAEQTLALARRRRTRAALVFLDLVDFKVVNDELGHGAGDELLRGVAARVLGELRTADTLARMGGDEFAVLLSEVESRDAALHAAGRLLVRLEEPLDVGAKVVTIEGRAGVAVHPEDGEDLSSLLKCADRALIRAKAGVAAVVGDGA